MRSSLSQRPRIHLTNTAWDNLGESLSIIGLVLGGMLLIMLWVDLPNQITSAFLLGDEPLAWSGRWAAVMPISLALLNHVLLTLMTRMPHYFHYPWPITILNAEIQYRLARSMLIWLNAVIIWMLISITWTQMRLALGEIERFPPLLVIISLMLIHAVMLSFLYRAYRCRDGDPSQDPLVFNR